MKRRSRLGIVLLGCLCLFSLPILWKAAAPFRMKRQFEEQAREQLRGGTTLFNGKLEEIRVRSLRYNLKSKNYDVKYTVSWSIPKSPYRNSSLTTGNKCSLKPSSSRFWGSCSVGIPISPNKSSFVISMHE